MWADVGVVVLMLLGSFLTAVATIAVGVVALASGQYWLMLFALLVFAGGIAGMVQVLSHGRGFFNV